MRKLLALGAALVAALVTGIVPASAITDGELDGDGHPGVVLLLMEIGGKPAFRCSGTLLSPTVVLTAGHCTNGFPGPPYTGMRVFTEPDVQNGNNNYPLAGPNSVEAVSWAAHPLFETAPFYFHDVGVVVLKEPGVVLADDDYGVLPQANQLDQLKTRRGQQDVTFTTVGYGVQKSFPDAASWKDQALKVRMVAHPKLNQINVPGFVGDFALLLSANASTGGACFGDSGGPNFLGTSNVVAGIQSFATNSTCGGTQGAFRADRQDVLDFVNSYLDD